MNQLEPENSIPLCIDLDGSLVNTDLLWESFIRVVRQNILLVFLMPFWLLKGISFLKGQLATCAVIDIANLPYNQDVLEYIKQQQNRDLVLCTGSHEIFAHKIAQHLGLFSNCLASNDQVNLTGRNKARLLIEKYGEGNFDYLGNERKDEHIWQHANAALVVSNDNVFIQDIKERHQVSHTFPCAKNIGTGLVKQLRLHQWLKNILIAVPFLLTFTEANVNAFLSVLTAFLAFGFVASGTYILNDLFDLDSDRAHLTKCKRPLASGTLPIHYGIFSMCALILLGFCLSLLFLPIVFIAVLAIYFIITLSYSFLLKTVAIMDVCVLAGLYTLRVIAGTVAISAEWSFWLLAFSMFIFLSLALAKRGSELVNLAQAGKTEASGRNYKTSDIPIVNTMGISSGLLSVLVVALYINDEQIIEKYAYPQLLWIVCPALLYWVGRVWLKTSRGEMHEDPVVFAMTDKTSWLLAVTTLIVAACGYTILASA